ncbi:MAG: 3-phosphoshikimate 1-carboxyvinyltransferase [Candidatus Bathyarchaeia archaeon]
MGNIVLIGFMGTGKSTVGHLLAERLGRELLETDMLIERSAGKPIPSIFREEGEMRFRELEMEAVKEASLRSNVVIACGGGVVLNKLNIDRLRRSGVTVLLEARPEIIVSRLSGDENERPLLASPSLPAIRELLAYRAPFYERAADLTVDVSDLTAGQVVEEILKQLQMAEVQPCMRALSAEVEAPRSRSFTNRALVIAALASTPSVLLDASLSEDTARLIDAFRQFGVRVEEDDGRLAVAGTAGKLAVPSGVINVGDAGTAMRFLVGVACLARGKTVLNGDRRMRERPIQDLLDALEPLGVHAYAVNGDGCPPVVVEGGSFEGGETVLRGETSSQYLSSILMVAPYAERDVTVNISGELTSKPYVDMTVALMRQFNVEVLQEGYRRFTVKAGQRYVGREFTVERDAANASYLLAAAAITGGTVRVLALRPDSPQGEARFADVLAKMGCHLQKGGDWVEVRGGQLHAVEVDMNSMPDAVQTLAVVAAFAKGRTLIRNVANLEQKETRRLTATVAELTRLGVAAGLLSTGTSEPEGLWVEGGQPHSGVVNTYGDHRMAMSFALMGLRASGIRIKDPWVVRKSYPDFWQDLERRLSVELRWIPP